MTTIDFFFHGIVGLVLLRWIAALGLASRDWLVQRRRRPDPADIEPLTVVVPAWNEERVIARTINGLMASNYPDLHILIVDDGSTDETVRRVEAIADVQLLRLPTNSGKAHALNEGLRYAKTRLVATVDADTVLDPLCLRWLVSTQRYTDATAVAANVRVGNRQNAVTRFQSLEYVAALNLDRRALHQLGLITTVPGAAALWCRDRVLEVGGFSSDTLAEDTDLSLTLLRQGHRLVFQDRADAFTEAPTTVVGLFRQRRRWLRGNLSCIVKHGLARGAPWPLRLIGLPNLWFAHVGVYLLPLTITAWLGLRGIVDPPLLATFATVGALLDWGGLLLFYLLDRADPADLLYAPLQRFLFPWFAWGVFFSVAASPPRRWAQITRRGDRLLR